MRSGGGDAGDVSGGAVGWPGLVWSEGRFWVVAEVRWQAVAFATEGGGVDVGGKGCKGHSTVGRCGSCVCVFA